MGPWTEHAAALAEKFQGDASQGSKSCQEMHKQLMDYYQANLSLFVESMGQNMEEALNIINSKYSDFVPGFRYEQECRRILDDSEHGRHHEDIDEHRNSGEDPEELMGNRRRSRQDDEMLFDGVGAFGRQIVAASGESSVAAAALIQAAGHDPAALQVAATAMQKVLV